jgi:hypothetical protein
MSVHDERYVIGTRTTVTLGRHFVVRYRRGAATGAPWG